MTSHHLSPPTELALTQNLLTDDIKPHLLQTQEDKPLQEDILTPDSKPIVI
jgi:hypothetical protein